MASSKHAERLVVAFTDNADDFIVQGFVRNRRATILKLESMGYRRPDIIARASHLGLTDQFLKKCSLWKPELSLRPCLCCGARFLSLGHQNRVCLRCKR